MISIKTNKGTLKGVIVKENTKTVVVKLENGKYIKRQKSELGENE